MNAEFTQRVRNAAKYVVVDGKRLEEKEAIAQIEMILSDLGIVNDDLGFESLNCEEFKWGDFREGCKNRGVAVISARQIFNGLSLKKTEEEATEILKSKSKPIGQWTLKELLEAYSDDCNIKIYQTLETHAHGRPFIVFNEDGTVNVEMSTKFLHVAKKQDTPTFWQDANHKVYRLYKVNEFASAIYDVCPVTGEIMVDGYCSKLGIRWDISLEAKQFIAIMVSNNIKVADKVMVHFLIETVKKDGLDGLKAAYPQIGEIFETLKATSSLPSLKQTATQKSKGKCVDPFKTVVYYETERRG